MPEKCIIRKATNDDLVTLLEFEQNIIKTEQAFDPTIKTEKTSYYDLAAMLGEEKVAVVVAELRQEIIASGYARIRRSDPFLQHREHAFLGFMYTVPAHRGKGINKQIIDYLIAWSRSENIREFRLQVYEQNSSAIRAYEKLGFEKHITEMRWENK